MKRLILTFLAVISLLLGVFAAIGSQTAPAQADTVIPVYGCPATLDGSPIGGGAGYSNIVDPSQADYVVSTAAQLKSALAAATSGQIVYVADGAVIVFNAGNYYGPRSGGAYIGCYVKAGVTLAGGRGNGGVPAVLTWDSSYVCPNTEVLVWCEADAKVLGLNLWGANETTSEISGKKGYGVYCGSRVEVANCEIHGCTHGGVGVFDSVDVWVHHNYFHDNIQAGMGYGVVIYPNANYAISSVIVEGNRFHNHRHAVCGSEPRACWTVRYNYVDGLATSSVFDQHGSDDHEGDPAHAAGGNIQIYNNTSVDTSAHFVNIRGEPYPGDFISVHHNWTYNTSAGAIIQQFIHTPGLMYNAYEGTGGHTGGPFRSMEAHDNWWGTAPPPSTIVAPVLNAIGNKSIKEGATLSFAISASDANGDALTYSASNLPVGATFNSTNRTFSWTPSLSQAGIFAGVRFQVSDGQATDYEEVTVTVIDEVAPVLSAIGNKSTNEGATLSFAISASDANGDALTYSASNLPVGATFNSTNRTFSWTPSLSQAGIYAGVHFQVSDGQMTDYEDITITVSDGVQADVNSDGSVNSLDLIRVGQHWNETGVSGWIPEDINRDGTVNVLDATLVGQFWTG